MKARLRMNRIHRFWLTSSRVRDVKDARVLRVDPIQPAAIEGKIAL
jgi:hypothetical protein